MRAGWLMLSVFIAMNPLYAAIYKWTDNKGVIHFSDSPHAGAEEIKHLTVQTYSSPSLPTPLKLAPVSTQAEKGIDEKITILQPKDQATLRNTDGVVSLIMSVKPKLREGDTLQVILDGALTGTPQASTTLALKQINRGQHVLLVQRMDRDGRIENTSSPVTIYLMPPHS